MNVRFVILAKLVLFFCLSINLDAQQNNESKPPYASDKPISEPVVFIPAAFGSAITPDCKMFYFAKYNETLKRSFIMKTTYENGKWTTPDTAEFTGHFSDGDPFISADGSKIFFWSNRPVDNNTSRPNSANIWMAVKSGDDFNNPVFLGKKLGISNGGAPTVSSNNNIYFFSKNFSKPEKGQDIYKSEFKNGEFSTGINLGAPVNSVYDDLDSYISPNEDYILFTSSRPGGYGSGDIYISFITDGTWSNPMNLGNKVNSSGFEYCPIVSPDGNYLFFTSNKSGTGSIYQLDFKPLLDSLRSNINVSAVEGFNTPIEVKTPISIKNNIEKVKFSRTPLWLKPYLKTINGKKQIYNKINTAKLDKGIYKAKVEFTLENKSPYDYQYVVTLNLLEANPAFSLKSLHKGLRYDYYEDTVYRKIPDFTKLHPKKSGIANNIDLSSKERDTLFAMVFSGYMNIDKAGQYTFCINSDDGSRLYMDDDMIIDNDGLHAPTEKYGTVCLAKGLHKIKIEYVQGSQGSILDMYFADPDTGAKVKAIANEQLFYK